MSALRAKMTVKEPILPEFLEIDTPIFIRIKHPNHHLNRMRIKTRKITIDQRLPQLSLRQATYAGSVDCLEKREQRRVGGAAAWGWCPRRPRWR